MKKRALRSAAAYEWFFLFAGGLLLAVLPHVIWGDGTVRYNALLQLMGGHVPTMKYSLVGPLFALPLLWLGLLLKNPMGVTATFNTFVLLMGMAVLFLSFRKHMPAPAVRSFLLILLFGSMMPVHALSFYGEMFTSVTVAAGTASAVCSGGTAGWIWPVLGVMNTPMNLVGYGLMVMRDTFESRRLRFLLLILFALALIMIEARLRRGGFFVSGYEGEHGRPSILPYGGMFGFSYPLFFGMLSLTFSFGKGLLFFAPGLLVAGVAMRKARPAVAHVLRLWLWYLLGVMLVAAMWYDWDGGWFWGPRLVLFASFPASLALALYLRDTLTFRGCFAALFLLALSFWVGYSGLVFNQNDLGLCLKNNAALELLCYDTPEFSALWRPFVTGSIFHPGTGPALLGLLWSGAWLCTAWPVLGRLRSLTPGIRKKVAVTLNWRTWRF